MYTKQLNNTEFLENLKFFNENKDLMTRSDEANVKLLGLLLFLGLCVLTVGVMAFMKPEQIFLTIAAYISGSYCLYAYCATKVINKNSKIDNFSMSVYTGDLEELFGDMKSSNVSPFLNEIKRELDKNAGITGHFAYCMYHMIHSPYEQQKRLDKAAAQEKIKEIENIQLSN